MPIHIAMYFLRMTPYMQAIFMYLAVTFVKAGLPSYTTQYAKSINLENWFVILIFSLMYITGVLFNYFTLRHSLRLRDTIFVTSLFFTIPVISLLVFLNTENYLLLALSALGMGIIVIVEIFIVGAIYQRDSKNPNRAKIIARIHNLKFSVGLIGVLIMGGVAVFIDAWWALFAAMVGSVLIMLFGFVVNKPTDNFIKNYRNGTKKHICNEKHDNVLPSLYFEGVWSVLFQAGIIMSNIFIIDKFGLSYEGPTILLVVYMLSQITGGMIAGKIY